jgi:hypothetical protein
MDAETLDLLYLMGEVSIATVALSGITMVLAVSGLKLTDHRVGQITIQLRMAFLVVAFSILPLVLLQFELAEGLLWRLVTGSYLLVIFVLLIRFRMQAEGYESLPPSSVPIAVIASIGALTLLPLNLWLAESWPYMVQLFIGWAVSMGLFIRFMYEILSERRDQGGT